MWLDLSVDHNICHVTLPHVHNINISSNLRGAAFRSIDKYIVGIW